MQSVFRTATDGSTIKCNDSAAWNDFFPMSLERAQAIIAKDLPPTHIGFDFVETDNKLCHFNINQFNDAFWDHRTFDPVSGFVNEGSMKVMTKAEGIGRKLMRNEMDFFYSSGFSEMQIAAGAETGGYTWARFGFLPMPQNDLFLKKQLLQTFNAFSPYLRKADRRDLAVLVQLRDPTDIWHIADRQDDLRPWIRMARKLDAKPMSVSLRQLANTVYGRASLLECLPNMDQRMRTLEGTPTLGKCFLMGSRWKGSFKFENSEQVKRASDYVGGFNCIPD